MLIPSNSKGQGEMRETARFVQATFDALSAHIAILNHTGDIVGVNAAWRQFAESNGFKNQTHGIGLNYLAVCDRSSARNSSDAPVVAKGIRDIISGIIDEFEIEYPCHSPVQRRWFVVRVSRFDWYGEVRLIVAHQNVTELKQVQIELEQSKRRIEAILNNINNGIITISERGLINSSNQAASRIFGYDPGEMEGMHLSQMIGEPFDGRRTFKHLNSEDGHEIVGVRKDRTTFPASFSLNELKLEDGSLYTCIIQDITMRKRMEAEIVERERMAVALDKERELRELKNRFLSMMSHELRTPLTSLRLSSDMLIKYAEITNPDDREALDNIGLQVEYLTGMVDDVLTLSRTDINGFSIEQRETDLITYCRDVVEEYQFAHHRTHQLEFECSVRIIRAWIDRKFLRRAFTNLLSNAVKYSPSGSTITFSLSAENGWAAIQVRDQGIGIPPEDQARLFEPFHRATNVGVIPGTGLGLPITRQMIELHGGNIYFETGPEGTTFFIHLPLHPPIIPQNSLH